LKLVVEYHERQHSEEVKFFDRRIVASGVTRGEQRRKYDLRRRQILPENGLCLVEFSYEEFEHSSSKRLRRRRALDRTCIQNRLQQFLAHEGQMRDQVSHNVKTRVAGGESVGATRKVWVVRAGRSAIYAPEFIAKQITAIGWGVIGSLKAVHTREEISSLVHQSFPEYNRLQVANATGQIFRFREELVLGSIVMMYDPANRLYQVGKITGEYKFNATADEEMRHTKPVEWTDSVSRDALSPETKNSLGSIATIFCVSDSAAHEILTLMSGPVRATIGEPSAFTSVDETDVVESESTIRQDVEQRALEFMQDRMAKLEWDQMQELVAGLLRAMGYKTQVSLSGADRGRDIVASPDGFGFQGPRIVVEVKHRKGTIGAPEIRAFLGCLRQNDNGLYVSTGGFTREARYEAERANHHIALLDMDGFGKSVMEHYDAMDTESRALLPLKKIYWPA
jgi:restriction system protein